MSEINDKAFSQTNAAAAMMEIAEDRVADAIKHLTDVTTADGKPCTVDIKITITPNLARNMFGITVSGGMRLSARPGAESTIFASVESGHVAFVEYDPQQSLPFK